MAKRPSTPALPPVAIVVSRYNRTVTDALLAGALAEYTAQGGLVRNLAVIDAPGAYELPTLAQAAAQNSRIAGVCALGCIIKGATRHDQVIADAIAQGLLSVSLSSGKPCALGVLTVNTPAQALERAGGSHGNKGQEAMAALLGTLASAAHAHAWKPGRGLDSTLTAPDKLAATGKGKR